MQSRGGVVVILFLAGCGYKPHEMVCEGSSSTADDLEKVVVVDCARDVAVDSLTVCLASEGPDACLAKLETPLCDSDGDGLADDLEKALARAYAPAFAFNGGGFGGDAETHWPANAAFFLKGARLTFGLERDLVEAHPTLETLAAMTSEGRRADDACEGADFWLCAGERTDASRVTSVSAMRAVPGGIDVLSVAHPANGPLASSSHLFVSFSLFFPFNAHSTVGDHEGDWEGLAVFVNRESGAIDGAWFERHPTRDDDRFVSASASAVRDAATEPPRGTLSADFSGVHGLRFWDYAGARRHVVAYVATGSHAMYDYPASTSIVRYGPRDTHAGDGPKILPWLSRVTTVSGTSDGDALEVSALNPGEPKRITLPWARFRGQWGCDDRRIAQSWPGPFGNTRHPRPMFERAWGSPPKAP